MKIKFLILLSISLLFIFACDDGIKFDNPNDEKNKAAVQQGELGGECYPNKTCDEGLTCDKENNTCVEEPKNTNDDDETDTASENDENEPVSDDSDSTPDEADSIDDSGDSEPDENNSDDDSANSVSDDDSDSTDTTHDKDNDNPNGDSETNDNDSSNSGVYDIEPSPDEDLELCEDSCVPLEPDCLPAMNSEYDSGLCNGLDDDCDGKVDEGCPCSPGQTQPCFLGPKNYRNVGTCRDGVQTCKVTVRATTGVWGDCVGGISPSLDVCDNADNNCNGCSDDKLCCQPPIDCSYDLTVDGDFLPFKYKIIDGNKIYDASHKFNDGESATWEWSLTKGPCDEVLGKVNSYVKGGKTAAEVGDVDTDNGAQSTVVSGVGFSQFKVKFRLSGNYKLHLKVTRPNGEIYECDWVIRVVSAGLRIELCWDTNDKVDVDLHMGKNGGTTSAWNNPSACYFSSKSPSWGYPPTANYDKDGNWKTSMHNPRLDIDNIHDGPIPENINIDNPEPGDVFRVGARYYPSTSPDNTVTHPVINVYCGGTLKATYGVDPQVNNFKNKDDFWKAVEVTWVGDYSSDACELNLKWDDSTGYVVNKQAVPTYTSW